MYCKVRRPSPIGIDAYGIHSRTRHMVFESQRWFQASSQYSAVSTAMVTQNDIASSVEINASHQRLRRPRYSGSTSTLTCPRVIRTKGLPMKVAATRL